MLKSSRKCIPLPYSIAEVKSGGFPARNGYLDYTSISSSIPEEEMIFATNSRQCGRNEM
jgi:hypothetical protein